jgi:hypothetical protein
MAKSKSVALQRSQKAVIHAGVDMRKLKFELEKLETRLASQARHQMDAPNQEIASRTVVTDEHESKLNAKAQRRRVYRTFAAYAGSRLGVKSGRIQGNPTKSRWIKVRPFTRSMRDGGRAGSETESIFAVIANQRLARSEAVKRSQKKWSAEHCPACWTVRTQIKVGP